MDVAGNRGTLLSEIVSFFVFGVVFSLVILAAVVLLQFLVIRLISAFRKD
jgi:uncharacterized membrane protein YedE/YeeE